jgi:hypothetical protein
VAHGGPDGNMQIWDLLYFRSIAMRNMPIGSQCQDLSDSRDDGSIPYPTKCIICGSTDKSISLLLAWSLIEH